MRLIARIYTVIPKGRLYQKTPDTYPALIGFNTNGTWEESLLLPIHVPSILPDSLTLELNIFETTLETNFLYQASMDITLTEGVNA